MLSKRVNQCHPWSILSQKTAKSLRNLASQRLKNNSDFWYLISDFWYPVSGTLNLTPDLLINGCNIRFPQLINKVLLPRNGKSWERISLQN